MAKTYPELSDKLIDFIEAQKIFFVATAPDDNDAGPINLSPKGYDSLKVLDNRTVAYADYPGSGNETASHLSKNKNLTMIFLSFGKTPMILRLYGRGEVIGLDTERGVELAETLGRMVTPYIRQLILLKIKSVKTSCGYGVPYYEYKGERGSLLDWCKRTLSDLVLPKKTAPKRP